MSEYKIVNGKKVRVCKYGCSTQLVWSDEISGFIETEGKIAHTKDRCQSVKKQQDPSKEAKIANIVKMIQAVIGELESLK